MDKSFVQRGVGGPCVWQVHPGYGFRVMMVSVSAALAYDCGPQITPVWFPSYFSNTINHMVDPDMETHYNQPYG